MMRKMLHRIMFYSGPILLAYFLYNFYTLNVCEHKEFLDNPVTEYLNLLFGLFVIYYIVMLFYSFYDLFKYHRDHKLLWIFLNLAVLYFGLYIYVEKFILSKSSSAYNARQEGKELKGIDQPEPGLPIPKLMFRRTSAFFFDYGLYLLYLKLNFLLFAEKAASGTILRGYPSFFALVVWFVYFPIIECFSGKTLGKKMLNIRVVRKTGKKPFLRQTIIRHLMDFPDVLFFTIFIFIMHDSLKIPRRIGDRLGKTWVVFGKNIF